MSKLYIFGIGGTGSRVLRSLTMMLAAGVRVEASSIVPIIIDPDASNADMTRSVSLLNLYRDLRGACGPQGFFQQEVEAALPGYRLPIQDTDNKRFSQFIDAGTMSPANQALVRLLFSGDNLKAQMELGFKGNPNIGSVVLSQLVHSPEFEQFANSFAQGDRIFIISSIFGGTGASGFPLLLKTLRTGNDFPNYNLVNQAPVGAVTVLPYFKVQPDEESEIDSSTFISKAKSALAYYEDNVRNQVNALYFLADDMTNTYDNHEGGTTQKNDAHLIELLAANAIVDFCEGNYPVGQTAYKEFGIDDKQTSPVTFSSFYSGTARTLQQPLTQFLLTANCFEQQFDHITSQGLSANAKLHLDANFYRSPFVSNLQQMFTEYREWLREMKENTRSLDLFNLETDKPFEVVTGVQASRVMSLKSNYTLIFDRLNSAACKIHTENQASSLMALYYQATEKLVHEKFKF